MDHGLGGIGAPQPVTLATPLYAFRVLPARHLKLFTAVFEIALIHTTRSCRWKSGGARPRQVTEVWRQHSLRIEGTRMTIAIRPARLEDAGAIAHVHVESWRTTYAGIVPDAYLAGLDETLRTRLWHEWLGGGALIFVAEIDGSVVGFAHGGANREPVEACDAELYSIYLLREVQKRGIGAALLRSMAGALLE